jgi:hypothetical protein
LNVAQYTFDEVEKCLLGKQFPASSSLCHPFRQTLAHPCNTTLTSTFFQLLSNININIAIFLAQLHTDLVWFGLFWRGGGGSSQFGDWMEMR